MTNSEIEPFPLLLPFPSGWAEAQKNHLPLGKGQG